jgi:hypothetical protein
MHVLSVAIENVRAIRELQWSIPAEEAPGWHVVLGNNGSGKSSFLRSIGLALVGPEDLGGLRQSGEDWLRRRETTGAVRVVFDRAPGFDVFASAGAPPSELVARVRLERDSAGVTLNPNGFEHSALRSVWGSTARGWFFAGFGPYRRFAGGTPMSSIKPALARCLSLFDEQFALSEALGWLIDLWVLHELHSSTLFDSVQRFINRDGFLPHGVRLKCAEVQPQKRVIFVDGAGLEVPVEELSDGFRAALSLTMELVRHLIIAFGEDVIFPKGSTQKSTIDVPCVVLVDEIDAHLHPTWQRSIGQFLVGAFPQIQFIVSTHSPLVCNAAVKGTVYLLPEPGTSDTGRFLTPAEKDRLVFGNVLDAYGTGAFGPNVSQSPEGAKLVARLTELNGQELLQGLNEVERAERENLRAQLPSSSASLPRGKSSLLDQILGPTKVGAP